MEQTLDSAIEKVEVNREKEHVRKIFQTVALAAPRTLGGLRAQDPTRENNTNWPRHKTACLMTIPRERPPPHPTQ